MNNSQSFSFYFYDYETFGQHPAFDRPAQFAGLRTTADFKPMGEPLVIYCRPCNDYLPDPNAVLVTGITPQQALAQGVSEVEFAAQIYREFTQPNSCILGYNSIRFDDEVTRYLFYRNFYDPYGYCWQQGNSRWDLLDVARACYALRPQGVEWPLDAQGLPSFKLQQLSQANGIDHYQAHDALSDVYATIGLAKRLRQAQPRLFDYLFQQRTKHKSAALIDVANLTPLVHVSGMFGAKRSNISYIAPLAWHPGNQNAVIACDLAGNIEPLLTQTVDILYDRLYTKQSQLAVDQPPIPLKLIHMNRCPVLAPANTLRPENIQRLGFNQQHCFNTLSTLRTANKVRDKVTALFQQKSPWAIDQDIDARLYDGFFSAADRAAMEMIPHMSPEQLPLLKQRFQDARAAPLLFRYQARHFPDTLDSHEQQQWVVHRQQLLNAKIEQYRAQLTLLMQQYAHQPAQYALLQDVLSYAEQLVEENNATVQCPTQYSAKR